MSATYITAHGNPGSFTPPPTPRARPGIEPGSSWPQCQVLKLLSHSGSSSSSLVREDLCAFVFSAFTPTVVCSQDAGPWDSGVCVHCWF